MNYKFSFKGVLDEWTEDGDFKREVEEYYFNDKNIDIDLLINFLKLLEQPNTSIDREWIKKQIDEL